MILVVFRSIVSLSTPILSDIGADRPRSSVIGSGVIVRAVGSRWVTWCRARPTQPPASRTTSRTIGSLAFAAVVRREMVSALRTVGYDTARAVLTVDVFSTSKW